MKNFNVRLSAIGGFLLLVSIAFALAQHDSRRHGRNTEDVKPSPSQPAVPIAMDLGKVDWHQAPDKSLLAVVRGNDNQLYSDDPAPLPPAADSYDNPLRESAQAYAVITASGEEPANPSMPPALPTSPPSWLTETLPTVASQTPPPYKTPSGLQAATIPPLPSAAQLPSTNSAKTTLNSNASQLPVFPMVAGAAAANATREPPANPSTLQSPASTPGLLPANNSLPIMPAPLPASSQNLPPQIPATGNPSPFSTNPANSSTLPTSNPATSNPAASMSDTQRGVMSATSFPQQPVVLPNNPSRSNEPPSSAYAGQSNFNNSQLPNSSGRTPAALTSLVSNEPGSRYLDGSQNPIMLIQKRGPEEVRVGKKATFVITVRNAGNSTAHDVTVVDSVPLGMRFSEANPPANPNAEGILTWKLGEMPAGDERTLNLQMVPERQGELGSVATVHFTAQASLRTVATQPKLEIQIEAQPESLIGDSQLIAVTVKNVGTGVARGVRLEADLPAQLRHESGDQHLEAIFPNELAPSQSQRIELRSTAAQPGDATCMIRALTEDGAETQQQVPITVLAPALAASIEGPRLRYLDRQATYKFKVQNHGTAPATNLKFVVRLPSGLRFNASDNNLADYSPADHTVSLGLQELPVGQPAVFELTVLPVERGTQVLTLNATADLGLSTEAKTQVVVEGLAELAFTIGQDNGTIEVGSSSTYTVQVTNIGNNPDKDVRLAVQLPAGAQVLKVDAPVRYRAEGSQILFEPIPEMRHKDQHTFRFQVKHTQAGSLIVRTQLTSSNWPVAVVKEEGTLVYDDQN